MKKKYKFSMQLTQLCTDHSVAKHEPAILVETYPKVQTQIMTIYKQNERNKLLFAGT